MTESGLQCATTMLVARHGEAAYVERVFSDEGGSLTARGRHQAEALAEALAWRRVAHVWASDMSRAVQTAEIVAARLGVAVTACKSLREVFVGDLLGSPFEAGRLEQVCDRWSDGEMGAAFPGGESGHDVVARYADQLAAVADLHRGETVLVVGHQLAVRTALSQLVRGLSPVRARDEELDNGEFAEVSWDDHGAILVSWPG